jgi:hypothetical protein
MPSCDLSSEVREPLKDLPKSSSWRRVWKKQGTHYTPFTLLFKYRCRDNKERKVELGITDWQEKKRKDPGPRVRSNSCRDFLCFDVCPPTVGLES